MANLDSSPSLSDLLSGMKAYDTTDEWDVVVSYSVARLNALLASLWTNDPNFTASILFETTVKGFKPKDDYKIAWDIKLQSPTLVFTPEKSATLSMPLTGTWQAHQGDDYDKKQDIPEGYSLLVTTPLMALKVKEGEGQATSQADMGTVISFDNDTNAKLHIVFTFAVKGVDSATCKVGWTKDTDEPTNPDVSSTLSKLKEYLQKNIKSLKYSLAAVTPSEVDNTVYLTPETMTFTLVTPSSTTIDQGCLSIYMKTKDSGNSGGHQHPVFRVKSGNSYIETYPISADYTASIIIRHKLFWEKFLQRCLQSIADNKNQKAFDTVDLTTPALDPGFRLTLIINRKYIVDSMKLENSSGGSSPWRVYLDKLTFDDSPVTVVINDGQMSWDMSFRDEKKINWEHDYQDRWKDDCTESGTVGYKASLSYKGSLLSTNQKQVNAMINISSDAWSHTAEELPGGHEFYAGEYPGVVQKAIDSLCYPGFSESMRLDYFATTNVFAPDQHIIDIDANKGVMTPHDILLVGSVVPPPSGSSASTSTNAFSSHYNPGA